MKFVKYLLALAIACFAITSVSNAQGTGTARLVGGGSSALFIELGQASQHITGISCLWSSGKTANIVARDSRLGSAYDEQGNFWVAWGPGTGTCAVPAGSFDVYSYQQLDSVVGDRCYFQSDASNVSGCTQIFNILAGAAGGNKVTGVTDTAIPGSVVSAIANARYNWAGTDVRPEDAKFATVRAFTNCNNLVPRQYFNQDSYFTYGLGYQTGTPHVGADILEDPAVGTSAFHVLDFNLQGNDPITNGTVPSFSTYSVGAQPILVMVAPITDTAGIGGATDVNGFTLSLFLQGVLGRTTDFFGPTTTKNVGVYIREPLSGTYNTMEYSIPNGTQYHGSQDFYVCDSASGTAQTAALNPLAGYSIGAPGGRHRAIGTGDMANAIQAATTSDNRLGYMFYSSGNDSGKTNVKYLKVNGIDPLLPSTTTYNGVLPGSGGTGDPGVSAVTFDGINSGNYPIWSILRLVSTPGNAYISNMLSGLAAIDSTQHDYLSLSKLKVWHSHFFINGIGMTGNGQNGNTISTANDLCTGSLAEYGGDAGGSVVLVSGNKDFCSDFSVQNGLINKTQ